MITVDHITKNYEKQHVAAIRNISFNVKKGELFGLIGPDGAGKTTIFRILATLILASEGKVTMAGLNVVKQFTSIRKIIGYMPGRFSLYQDLTVKENLEFFATLFGTTINKNYDLIRDIYIQIEPFKNRRAGKLSGGMKQKLALCCALVHRPEILLLDEPTTGVDAVSRKEFWEMLKRLKAQGITILVSTPYMDEANICDRIALINKGEIMGIDTPHHITAEFPVQLYAMQADNNYSLLKELRTMPQVESAYPFGEKLHVTVYDCEVVRELEKRAVRVEEIDAGIEDSFIRLMNKNAG